MDKTEIIARGEAATMKNYGPLQPIVIERGEGVYLYDTDGRRYLDFTAGIASQSLGHAHKGYLEAVTGQMAKISHLPSTYMTEAKMSTAELLVRNSCFDEVFFANTGTESVEGALKLARKWAKETKGPEATETICFTGSFHGRTFGALSVTGKPENADMYAPALSGVHWATLNDIKSVKAQVSPRTACIIIEPIQGESGVHPAQSGFLADLRELCDRENIALIFDEIQTGIGRTGKLFACEHFGVEPDVMTLAKGLGNGFPVGAILAKKEFSRAFTAGAHGSTFGGNPAAMAAATFVLHEVLKPGFMDNISACGARLRTGLETLQASGKAIADVRGMGLMIGVDITKPQKDVLDACRERGLLPWKSGTSTLRLLPPLIVTEAEIDEGLAVLDAVL